MAGQFERLTYTELSLGEAVPLFDEVLTAKQHNRLQQILLYAVVAAQGYSKAFTDSRLCKALEIRDDQKPELLKTLQAAEINCARDVQLARAKLLEDALKKLTPEQEQQARNQLGEFFVCPPYYYAGRKEAFRATSAKNRQLAK